MSKAAFFAFDTETTGLSPSRNEIISFSAQILAADLSVISKFTTYAFPDKECEPAAAALNGYTPEAWTTKGACTQVELVAQIRRELHGHNGLIPVGHYVKFDLDFLYATFARHNARSDLKYTLSYHSIDTVGAAILIDIAKLGSKQGNYKLTKLCTRFGISLGDKAHEAEADIQATVDLLQYLIKAVNSDVTLPPGEEDLLVKFSSNTSEWLFTRGKHENKSFAAVHVEDPSYLSWVVRDVSDIPQEAKDALCSIRQAQPSPV